MLQSCVRAIHSDTIFFSGFTLHFGDLTERSLFKRSSTGSGMDQIDRVGQTKVSLVHLSDNFLVQNYFRLSWKLNVLCFERKRSKSRSQEIRKAKDRAIAMLRCSLALRRMSPCVNANLLMKFKEEFRRCFKWKHCQNENYEWSEPSALLCNDGLVVMINTEKFIAPIVQIVTCWENTFSKTEQSYFSFISANQFFSISKICQRVWRRHSGITAKKRLSFEYSAYLKTIRRGK